MSVTAAAPRLTSEGPIVMVDDNPGDRSLASRCFRRSRLANDWITFPSGVAFLDYIEGVKAGAQPMPALVLLDLNMPAMTGFDVLERLRSDESFRERPVVCILTSSRDPYDVDRAHDLGAAGFYVKPYDIGEYVSFFEAMASG